MGHRKASVRVNGVGILPAILDIELAIIAGRNDSAAILRNGEYALNVRPRGIITILRSIYPYPPRHSLRIPSATIDFSYINQHILNPDGTEIGGNQVRTVTLSNGIEIEFHHHILPGRKYRILRDKA